MRHIEDVTTLKGNDAFLEASIQLIEQTSRHLHIRSALLDPDLFDKKEFNEALSAFARSSRYAEVQILVDYPDRIQKRGHKTLDLMRRLSQKIIIIAFQGNLQVLWLRRNSDHSFISTLIDRNLIYPKGKTLTCAIHHTSLGIEKEELTFFSLMLNAEWYINYLPIILAHFYSSDNCS